MKLTFEGQTMDELAMQIESANAKLNQDGVAIVLADIPTQELLAMTRAKLEAEGFAVEVTSPSPDLEKAETPEKTTKKKATKKKRSTKKKEVEVTEPEGDENRDPQNTIIPTDEYLTQLLGDTPVEEMTDEQAFEFAVKIFGEIYVEPGGEEPVRDIISSYGVKRFKMVPVEKGPEMLDKALALRNARKADGNG